MAPKPAMVLGLALALAACAEAHGHVSGIVAEGTYYLGYDPSFQYLSTQPELVAWATPQDLSNGFIAPDAYTTDDIICHLSATPGVLAAPVAAGDTVDVQWTTWPDSHHGPVIAYLANCNGDCGDVDKTTLLWTKIQEGGLIDDSVLPGTWETDKLIANNNTGTVTIPSSIAAGNYVLRHEIIALHSAGTEGGAQNYPFCVNIEVTGSGTNSLTSGTLATAFYTPTDPGILVNIYATIDDYVIPGPALLSS